MFSDTDSQNKFFVNMTVFQLPPFFFLFKNFIIINLIVGTLMMDRILYLLMVIEFSRYIRGGISTGRVHEEVQIVNGS